MRTLLVSLFSVLLCAIAQADTARFDLTGPSIQIKVTRDGKTLPISQVPNLQPGDRLWIHPNLPDDQTAHYLLVVTFLRGTTNPPPDDWFTRAETWNKKIREEGVFTTVPDEAQQAVIFLAPETGGDFSTLRSAVRGKPGSFVRSVQDLDQASLDRARLDTYLAAIHTVAEADPSKVHATSELLARSLNIHLDEDCFKKPVEEQASCLTQKGGDLVLNDGHSQSVVSAIANGSASDLIGQLSATPQAGLGYYSPYVGAIMDMGRILDSLHTAQYQYIPALTLPKKEALELKLNNPPSFHNPKSVIVIALPAVKKEKTPPLRPINDQVPACAQRDPLVLAAENAPLVFSTQLAHDLTVHLETKNGKNADVAATADASRGGLVLTSAALLNAKLDAQPGDELKATLHGKWGFDPFTGPTFKIEYAKETKWSIPSGDTSGLMAGSAHVLHLQSPEAACTDEVSLKDEQGKDLKVQWKIAKADEVQVTIPVESAKVSGPVNLEVKQAGVKDNAQIPLRIYGEASQLKKFTVIPGDTHADLQGSRLDDVDSVEVGGTHFARPAKGDGKSVDSNYELQLVTANSSATASLHPDEKLKAQVKLKDGRTVDVPVTVETPRPRVSLLNKAVELGQDSKSSPIHLAKPTELPQDAKLSFSIKSDVPNAFPRNEKIEIATANYSFHALLGVEDGSLTLQDPQTVIGHFDPAKSFGNSAFGELRLRPVDERGVQGDWIPLATLVRIPSLTQLDCPPDAGQPCTLKGKNLFLLDAVAADTQFSHPASVPQGFIGDSMPVPHPANGTLYVKLRDDPSDVNTATLPQASPPPPPSPPAKAPQTPPAPATPPPPQ